MLQEIIIQSSFDPGKLKKKNLLETLTIWPVNNYGKV